MAIKFKNPVNLPSGVLKDLDTYLEEGEEIIDAIRETLILAIDFRWTIITSFRVIIAIEKFMSVEFRDVHFDGIDMQLTKGFFYDDLHLKSMTDDYHAQYYTFSRTRTEKFLHELEDVRNHYMKEKKKNEKMVEQEAMEELGAKGPLDEPRKRHDILADMDHDDNPLDPRIKEKRGTPEDKRMEESGADEEDNEEQQNKSDEQEPKCPPVNPIKTIQQLLSLKNKGAITEEEFQSKKKEILKRI
jgi:hypothetical protein